MDVQLFQVLAYESQMWNLERASVVRVANRAYCFTCHDVVWEKDR